ncbi:uncharacterized protein CC84DRAFT_1180627 [Paraphaeosphaeria sporulosa]|uniref:Uncharacterized protein n=1 Tax=Paraphaeosphaeria sporulosa TaxID=1460663 RepID=A0A177C181_9PLEO|nr:uncharacterized protein CC84DRAFT_1180627 [Paraphaeosphaeria sporulosa]OAG00639.1 hypothetical protein CC84DRAFT_1180627 [Paraphaeosphaeria sporulosa]
MSNLLPPPVVRIASEPLPRHRSLSHAYEGQRSPGGSGGPFGVLPETLHPPIPPPTLPSLPECQTQSGADSSRGISHLPPPPGVIGVVLPPPPPPGTAHVTSGGFPPSLLTKERRRFIGISDGLLLPPPPGFVHVAPEPAPRPIFPRPLPSLPAYNGQRVPGGPGGAGCLLDLEFSFQLQRWNLSNRLGLLWDYPPILEHESLESLEHWRRLGSLQLNLNQDDQLISRCLPNLVQVASTHALVKIRSLLNPAQDASIHTDHHIPHAESLSAAAARSREAVDPSGPGDAAVAPISLISTAPPSHSLSAVLASRREAVDPNGYPDSPISSTEVSNTPPWSNGPHPQSEPDLHLDRHDISPNLAPSHRLSLPPVPSFEDLSTLPAIVAQKLQYSAQLSLSTACASSSGPQYELVEEDYMPGRPEPVSAKVNGPFMSRHTANFEAAKMFTHRFWEQVMVKGQVFEAHIGEAGILTMVIRYEDGRGRKGETSVFVRRKGWPGAISGPAGVPQP